jgi:hypothetical protein
LPSCCAAVPGSTNLTTAAPPTGTATIRPTSVPTSAFAPAVSSPQHPSPSEPLEGIPAGVQEGSKPAPVIGDPRWQGLPRASDSTIRTTPAHCPTAPEPDGGAGLPSSRCSGGWCPLERRPVGRCAVVQAAGHGGSCGACHPAQGLSECGGAAPLRSGGWGFSPPPGAVASGSGLRGGLPAAAVASIACGIEVVAAGLLEPFGVASAAGCLACAIAQPCQS